MIYIKLSRVILILFSILFPWFYCNMRSLTKNHERLEQMSALFPCTPHLITISETKLNANSDQKCITLPHYSFCHSPSDTIAGGVGVYISDSLEYRLRDDLKFIEEENENTRIWIEIMGNNSILNRNPRCLTNIIIGVIYRCPSCPIKNFISNFQPTLQYLQNISSPFYITGDINIDLLSQSNSNVFFYNNLISSYNAYNLVTKATRITSSTATLIDRFYTNYTHSCSNCYIIKSDLTDHFPLAVKIHQKITRKQNPIKFIRRLKSFDKDKFCDDVEEACIQNINSFNLLMSK